MIFLYVYVYVLLFVFIANHVSLYIHSLLTDISSNNNEYSEPILQLLCWLRKFQIYRTQ